ncbi:MAG: hypothetical protein JJE47_07855 [Acidimicrobiia bacterium]|nr:hypothetical protein [Acidimicrobiia bacterium]
MIVCGGRIVGEGADAASYNPETDTWTVIATPPVAASFMEGVWTGDEVIVFGGVTDLGRGQNVGAAAYNPTTNQWRRLSNAPIPMERLAETALAAGSIYVWPSTIEPLQPQTPIEYIIEADRWELLPAPPAEYAPRSPTGARKLKCGSGDTCRTM